MSYRRTTLAAFGSRTLVLVAGAIAFSACVREPIVKRETTVAVDRQTTVDESRTIKPGGRPGGEGDCRAVRRDRADSAAALGVSAATLPNPCATPRDSSARPDSAR